MTTQLALFDYSNLDNDTRSFVRARTSEIKALAKRSAQDIIEIGQKLIEVRAKISHNKSGGFEGWLSSEFDWSVKTAQRFIWVAEKFNLDNLSMLDIAPSALYLLASPSTPEAAVEEAITQASNGHPVTHKEAKAIVGRHKESPESKPTSIPCEDCGEIFDRRVWHCPYCDHHWLTDRRDCANCHHDKPTKQEAQNIYRLREEDPDLFEDVYNFVSSISWAMRKLGDRKAEKRQQERQQPPTATVTPTLAPRLIVGDAANLSDIPSESIDVIITSPPYNLSHEQWPMGGHGREKRTNGIGYSDNLEDEAYQNWQLCVIAELYRVARPGASLFYNHKPRTVDGVLQHPMTWLCRASGWMLRQEIIWDREVTHNHSKSLFWPVDERIYWFTKGRPAINEDGIGMPSVWRFHGPQPYTWHPAPFSEELPRRCLQAVGRPGITVLDPFAGSCTTLKVALGMGYQAIGVDIEGDYLERAKVEYGW